MHDYTTAERFARARGLDVTEVRALARKGLVSGAIRVGGNRSPWAIPTDAVILSDPSQRITNGSGDTAARELGSSRAAADTRPNRADRSDVMSTGDSPAQIARRVENRVRNDVTTRPARALADVVFLALGEAMTAIDRVRAVLAHVEALCDKADEAHADYLDGVILDRFVVPAHVTTEALRRVLDGG